MKRNESVLVYGVTGLLLVILFVAVFFGNEGDGLARSVESEEAAVVGGGARPLSDVLIDPVEDVGPAVEDEMVDPEAEATAAEGEATEAEGTEGEETEATEPEPVVEAPPALEPGMYDLRRERQIFRRVTVQSGDSFSTLVQNWTGGLDRLPEVMALNETVDTRNLRPGQTLMMPYVEDSVLEAARRERRIVDQKREASRGQSYTVRPGDSLWKIAVRATGSDGRAPAYIEQVVKLNPGLVPERLRAGQKIFLPPQ